MHLADAGHRLAEPRFEFGQCGGEAVERFEIAGQVDDRPDMVEVVLGQFTVLAGDDDRGWTARRGTPARDDPRRGKIARDQSVS